MRTDRPALFDDFEQPREEGDDFGEEGDDLGEEARRSLHILLPGGDVKVVLVDRLRRGQTLVIAHHRQELGIVGVRGDRHVVRPGDQANEVVQVVCMERVPHVLDKPGGLREQAGGSVDLTVRGEVPAEARLLPAGEGGIRQLLREVCNRGAEGLPVGVHQLVANHRASLADRETAGLAVEGEEVHGHARVPYAGQQVFQMLLHVVVVFGGLGQNGRVFRLQLRGGENIVDIFVKMVADGGDIVAADAVIAAQEGGQEAFLDLVIDPQQQADGVVGAAVQVQGEEHGVDELHKARVHRAEGVVLHQIVIQRVALHLEVAAEKRVRMGRAQQGGSAENDLGDIAGAVFIEITGAQRRAAAAGGQDHLVGPGLFFHRLDKFMQRIRLVEGGIPEIPAVAVIVVDGARLGQRLRHIRPQIGAGVFRQRSVGGGPDLIVDGRQFFQSQTAPLVVVVGEVRSERGA